jgi:pyruvate/2-oxoglutarate dehydrogenase complex dihydrolipoamide dehydrogenase (E3) component
MSPTLETFDREWRELVFPPGYRNPKPAVRYNLVVIGAGPAGLLTSIGAAGLGARVALIEGHAMGGDCLNVGCVPSKALLSATSRGADFERAFAWLRQVRASIAHHDSVERYTQAGVDVFLGEARFVDAHTIEVGAERLRTRKTVIATGARAALPPIEGLAEAQPLTNETIFDLEAQPRRLAIVGAGPIGCELAQAFARLGTEVHLIDLEPRVLPGEDAGAASVVANALQRDGVRVHLGRSVARVSATRATHVVLIEGGDRVDADQILVATGRRRNTEGLDLSRAGVRLTSEGAIAVDERLATTHADIFAAGDACSRLQFTHNADAHARIVIQNALFVGRARTDSLIVPWCTYTSPELARVGLTRAEAEGAGRAVDVWRVEWSQLDRARTDAALEGFVEVLTEKNRDRIVGATIVGKDAGEQLAPLLLLMNNGLGLTAIGRTILPYPTRSEYLRRLADAYNRRRLTPTVAKAFRWWLGVRR